MFGLSLVEDVMLLFSREKHVYLLFCLTFSIQYILPVIFAFLSSEGETFENTEAIN